MKKILAGLACAVVSVLPNAGLAETVKVAHAYVENTLQGQTDKYFADLVTEATKGELQFEFFWAGSLGKANEILNLIRDGAIEMGNTAPIYYTSNLPIASLTNGTPFLFKDVKNAVEFQDTNSRTNPHFLKEYEAMGVFPILQHPLNISRMMCTKKVETIDDLAGLKVRTFGAYLPAALEALKMVSVTMDLNDVYEGLERGVVDCIALPYASVAAFKLYEVAKFWSDINLGASSGPVLYTSWNNYKGGGWSPEVIAAVDEASKKAMAFEAERDAQAEKDALELAIKEGATFTKFLDQDKVDAAVPDVLQMWRDLHVGKDVDAAVADEIIAAIRKVQDTE